MEADALLFDLDGVLVNSTACILRHWERWALRHGLDPAYVKETCHGRTTVGTMRIVAPYLPAEEEARRFEEGEAADTEGIAAIQGAAALLAQLPADTWAIVTSASRLLAVNRLRAAGLPLPAAMIAADDVRNGKPHPEPYLLGAKSLGVPPKNCVVIEDAPTGIQAGQAAGMQTIALLTTHTREDFAEEQTVTEALTEVQVTVSPASPRLVIRI
jgi:sugar-phosphatase